MTGPASPAPQSAMVRGLIVAIAIMTIAIVVIFGAMVAKLLSPTLDGAWEGTIDFAAAPIVEIGLPPGARVIASHVSAERVTLEIETVEGERSVYTTPLAGFDAPARLVFHTLE